MDQNIPALQYYNGGIIFVSYVIAVVGAMTTLELLQRRTHIRGLYNWFLLFAAAASMGGVGIWSMHFIGNNSLTIILDNGDHYQLSYSAGFTFASLIVAIITMFLAFTFVGITEEAKVVRIVPSGIVAGLGIVSMHYLGQLAIDFFRMKNKIAYVIGAIVIAICAVTAALFIFFKLREQWENQWYKRLGCAMLMGVAVCGMHYTALLGTVYYPGDSTSGPPTPVIATPALIGIISAIVVVSCVILCIVVAKTKMESLPFQKKSNQRLILDTIFFDTNGRILVKVDGVVPMKEVLRKIPENISYKDISTSHTLFIRLFETSVQWSKKEGVPEDGISYSQALDPFHDQVVESFVNAATELLDDLRLDQLSDLGHLFDSVISTNIIEKKSLFSHRPKNKQVVRRSSSTGSWLLTSKAAQGSTDGLPQTSKQSKNQNRSSIVSTPDQATVIDIFTDSTNSEASYVNNGITIQDSNAEDKHIFLVKKIDNNKDLVNLLSIGFRFAEPVFIAKTMGEKLKVPSEYMLNHFNDMLQMADTVRAIYNPIRPTSYSMMTNRNYNDRNNEEVRGGVFVGLFALVEDENLSKDIPHIIIDKNKRNTFPLVQLAMEEGQKITELTKDQKNTILSLSGQSLTSISTICSLNNLNTEINSTLNDSSTHETINEQILPTDSTYNQTKSLSIEYKSSFSHKEEIRRFTRALEKAAKALIGKSSYGKSIATSAKLYGDIIDIPAFSLRAGPCQLVLFRAHITTPGTRFAINQTMTETIKCVPFPLYKSFAYASTEAAVEKYRYEQNKNKSPSSYLTQQRLYQSTALRNKDVNESDTLEEHHESNSKSLTVYNSASKEQSTQNQPFSSLPPPPRAKRNKFNLPTGIDIGSLNKDFIPNMIKGAKSIPLSPVNNATELPIILNVLPVSGRFWWLHSIYEETHNNM